MLKKQKRRLVISTSDLTETQSLLLRRETPEFDNTYLDALLFGSDLINPATEDYLEAKSMLMRFGAQRISLFDACLAVLSQTLKLPVWAFDADFDVIGVDVWRA